MSMTIIFQKKPTQFVKAFDCLDNNQELNYLTAKVLLN